MTDRSTVNPPHDSELTFPDQPRLELDQLLRQLVERANEVMGTQGRLRGLLHANQMIGRDLGLPVVRAALPKRLASWSAPATRRSA